ncbi:MAG TPA: dihydrodipicolinate synthase family protein [Pyrinomonadaceae bacterium]
MLPIPTPFDKDSAVDKSALRLNIEKWIQTGIYGFVMLGSTGERVHLEDRECLEVIEAARGAVPEEMAFIAGAGQQSMRATIGEVRRVAEAGADAVLLITPHFYRGAMTQSALYSYYMAVADGAPVPVLLYSMPELTGIALAPETVARLSEHENIIGLKDSSGDIINFAETVRLVPKDFAVLTGSGPLLYAALAAGATGAILAVGCVAPGLAVDIYRATKAGEHERARGLQQKLTPLALAVTKRYGIGGLKAALDLIGYNGGYVRAPLQDASEEARREIARLLEESLSRDEAAESDEQYRLAGATE